MNLSRILRGPLFWIIIGIFALFLVMDLARGADGFEAKPTSEVIAKINGNDQLQEVELVENEQVVRVTVDDKNKMKANWVGDQSVSIATRFARSTPDARALF